jgi:type IV pilus assembly protein PilF
MRRHAAAAAASALVFAALAALTGCTSTVTTTDGKPVPVEEPVPTDPVSRARLAGTRLELASLYFGRGEMKTAMVEVNKALEAKSDYGQAYGLRGLIHAALGDNGRAEQDFQRALLLDPRDADTMQAYGWFLCQNGRYGPAEQQFQAALAQPGYRMPALAWRTLGICQARDGRLADAEASLLRSYQIDPSNPATGFNLADVLYRRGEYAKARFYIDRVNARPEQANAQTLWLAARVEYKLGNRVQVQGLGSQLRSRWPQAPETLAFEQGRFDE